MSASAPPSSSASPIACHCASPRRDARRGGRNHRPPRWSTSRKPKRPKRCRWSSRPSAGPHRVRNVDPELSLVLAVHPRAAKRPTTRAALRGSRILRAAAPIVANLVVVPDHQVRHAGQHLARRRMTPGITVELAVALEDGLLDRRSGGCHARGGVLGIEQTHRLLKCVVSVDLVAAMQQEVHVAAAHVAPPQIVPQVCGTLLDREVAAHRDDVQALGILAQRAHASRWTASAPSNSNR